MWTVPLEISPAFLSFMLSVIVIIIAVTRSHEKQSASIDLVKQDLENHKRAHTALEQRVIKHEEKIDERLADIQEAVNEVRELVIKIEAKK